jgi:uncharacterized membrane protein
VNTPTDAPSRPHFKLLDRDLRGIERTGWVLAVLYFGALLAISFLGPQPYDNVWQLVSVHMVAGRVGNIGLGLAQDYHWLFLLVQCTLQDVVFLLLVYPFVIAGSRKISQRPFFQRHIAKMHATAHFHKQKLEPYGAVGLTVFVLIPIFSTGILVGALIGHLLGMRNRVVFGSVILGNFLAVLFLLWFFDQVQALAASFGAYGMWVLVALIILGSVAGLGYKGWSYWRKRHRQTEPRD